MNKKSLSKLLAACLLALLFLPQILTGNTIQSTNAKSPTAQETPVNLEKFAMAQGDNDPYFLGPYKYKVIVTENAGIDRILEPIDANLEFGDGKCADAVEEVKVTKEDGKVIPSQVYNVSTYNSGYIKSCNVVFLANCTANSSETYYVYYGKPIYKTDLSLATGGNNIAVENSHYKVTLTTDATWISSLKYKDYDPAKELLKSTWNKLLAIVTEISGSWYGPWNHQFDINTYVKQSGPIFIDIVSVFENWTDCGIIKGVAEFRFYSRIPWFTYSVNLTLGATFGHLLISSYFSLTTLPYAAYRKSDETLTSIIITTSGGVGDRDWNRKWIDVENTPGYPYNPVGVALVTLPGTSPSWNGWRNGGDGEVAPFAAGALTKANLKLTVGLHTSSNYTYAENMYTTLNNPLVVNIGPKENSQWLRQYRHNVTLTENAGIDRVLEPIDIGLTFEDGECVDAVKQVRVTSTGEEMPSQVYNVTTYASGYAKSCNVVFLANCTANSSETYYVYYGKPIYETDLFLDTSGNSIIIENSHYKTNMTTNATWISSLRCKGYDPTEELLKADWPRLLTVVTEIAGNWSSHGLGGTFDIDTKVKRSGPVFIDVTSIFENWTGTVSSGIGRGEAEFRFYARLPWFAYSANLTLTGENFGHLSVSSYFSLTTLPYAAYRGSDGALKLAPIKNNLGDITNWNRTWIDAENSTSGAADNPVGVAIISMKETSPLWVGWRSDEGEIAPYTNGTLTKANLNLAVGLHGDSNYTYAENVYTQLRNPLTVEVFPKKTSMPTKGFSLSTLHTVHTDFDLNLYFGSRLLVKFYSYQNEPQGSVQVWSGIAPANVLILEDVTHPLGKPVEKATLELTDGTGTVLRTFASFLVERDDLARRLAALDMEWPYASPSDRTQIFMEIVHIDVQWPYAPPAEPNLEIIVASDRVTYKPLENVTITANVTNREPYEINNLSVRIEIAGSFGEQIFTKTIALDKIASGETVGVQTTWEAPNCTMAGFVAEASLLNNSSHVLAWNRYVFDVVENWALVPRYGFFSTPAFHPSAMFSAEKVQDLKLLHVNSLQFYDWFELHGNYTPTESQYSIIGHPILRDNIIEIIGLAHKAGMKCMAYTTIYSAAEEIYNQHTDWALTNQYGTPLKFMDWLYFMNPDTPCGWHDYLIDEFLDSMAMFNWDGIHLDQYGYGWTSDAYWNGEKVDMVKAFQHFINDAVGNITLTYPEGKLIFNYVTYWPECYEMMGKNTTVSALYAEVWNPYNTYSDIRYLIRQGKEYNRSKAVILAAYPVPSPSLATVLLLDAEIFANQGFHIELGEGNALLTDAYFPNYYIMPEDMVKALRSYYECITRYEQFIYDFAVETLPISAVQIYNYPYGISPSSNIIQVIPYARVVDGSEEARIVHFINFRGITNMYWKQSKPEPTTTFRIPVTVQIPSEKLTKIEGVYLINPDSQNSDPTSLSFTVNPSLNTINFTLPSLKYWDIIIVKYSNSIGSGQSYPQRSSLGGINNKPWYDKLPIMAVFTPMLIISEKLLKRFRRERMILK